MFDVLITSLSATEVGDRAARALRAAGMRVAAWQARAPLRSDVGLACARAAASAVEAVATLRAALGPGTPVVAQVPLFAGPDARTAGAVDVVPDVASDGVLVLRVRRAAASAERERSRAVLRGDLRATPLTALLAVLARRCPTCEVRLESAGLRGVVCLDDGRVTDARADGALASEAALDAMASWADGTFEVFARAARAPTQPPGADAPVAAGVRTYASTAPPATGAEGASEGAAAAPAARPVREMSAAARAVAVLNAAAACGRVSFAPRVVGALLRASLAVAVRGQPDAPRFDVTDDGVVSLVPDGAARAATLDDMVRVVLGELATRLSELPGAAGAGGAAAAAVHQVASSFGLAASPAPRSEG